MRRVRRIYRRLDEWILGFSRGEYAFAVGVTAGFCSLAMSLLLGDPNYVFAIGIGVTLAALNYWSDPNHREE